MDHRQQSSRRAGSRRTASGTGRRGGDGDAAPAGRSPSDEHSPQNPGAGGGSGGRGPAGRRNRAPNAQADSGQRLAARLTLAILPLRLFLGATFVYAGIDKLIDPTFLRTTGPGSIGLQLASYTHVSPLAPLIEVFALPAPILVGLLIALAEIAIGLGTLLGLAQRWFAIGGFGLSILFWLTASWATHPFYYGADLPYALGWLTLAIAGPVGWSIDTWWSAHATRGHGPDADPDRRRLIGTGAAIGLVGILAVALGGMTWLASGLFGRRTLADSGAAGTTGASADPGSVATGATAPPGTGGSATAAGTGNPAPAPSATPAPATPAGQVVGQLRDLPNGNSLAVFDPTTGDPAVVVRLNNGKVVCYDAICTHAGCTVEFDQGSELLVCPCHGAVFDPAHQARVLGGPTRTPLVPLTVTIDSTGAIRLA